MIDWNVMETKRNPFPVLVGVTALVLVVATVSGGKREAGGDVPPEAAGWYGAMSMYRALALWAGKRAMSAELNYWKAVG